MINDSIFERLTLPMTSHQPLSTPLMHGKRGIVLGVANEHSLAWGIAKHLHQHGADIAFTYPSEILKKRVEPLAHRLGSTVVLPCDVAQPDAVKTMFAELGKHWSSLDFIVHSISFSDKNELRGDFLDLSRDNFSHTMLVSCYSFIDVLKHARTMLTPTSSVLTLSYYGAEKVIPHYNGMAIAKSALETSVKYAAEDLGKHGVRVNNMSCGPIKTLAASGIGDFHYILQWSQHNSPLRRGITLDDAGKTAVYLLSDLSSGVTGETIHVDAGYHVVGMKAKDAPDITLPIAE